MSKKKHPKHGSLRVSWDGKTIAGVDSVSPLVRDVEVIKAREGRSPGTAYKFPGRTEYEPVTLERPAGGDTAFEDWVGSVGMTVGIIGWRKQVTVEVLDHDGGVLLAYRIYNCWPSDYQVALLAPGTRAAAVERLRLENDGWERA
jgi:phage tail-like protein